MQAETATNSLAAEKTFFAPKAEKESRRTRGCPLVGGENLEESKERLSWTALGILGTLILVIGGGAMGLLWWMITNNYTELRATQTKQDMKSAVVDVHELRLSTIDGKLSDFSGRLNTFEAKLDRIIEWQMKQDAEAKARENLEKQKTK